MKYNDKKFLGAKIINIREMTLAEYNAHYWSKHDPVYVIELDNGISLYPSKDAEGNSGGVLLGVDANSNKCFTMSNSEEIDTSNLSNDDFGAFIRGEISVDGEKIKTPLTND